MQNERPYSGRFEGPDHLFAIRVYFEDTDAGGVVYHANYLRFMERARSDMLRVVGIDQRGALDSGEGVYVVADVAIGYKRSARLDDDLLVISRVQKIGGARCVIHQRVMRGPDIVTDATVTAVFIAPDGRPRRQPPAWIEIFERLKGIA
jgi:acyl-CoA thioester hydrolase